MYMCKKDYMSLCSQIVSLILMEKFPIQQIYDYIFFFFLRKNINLDPLFYFKYMAHTVHPCQFKNCSFARIANGWKEVWNISRVSALMRNG